MKSLFVFSGVKKKSEGLKNANWPSGPCRPGQKARNGLPGPAGPAEKCKMAFRAPLAQPKSAKLSFGPYGPAQKANLANFFLTPEKKRWPPRVPVAWSGQPGGLLARMTSPTEHSGQTDVEMHEGSLEMHDFRSTNKPVCSKLTISCQKS